ncbi:MAG: putative porin [Pseudomonadota bacterium]
MNLKTMKSKAVNIKVLNIKTFNIKSIATIFALIISGAAVADSYQVDLGAVASHTKLDGSDNKMKAYGLEGAYYFNPVSTINVPLAEAAFLGKNSNVYAGALRSSLSGEHLNFYEVGAEFYIPENFLYVNAGALRATGDNFTDNDWYTSVGITPLDGLLVTTTYYGDEGYDANIAAKYVMGIGGDNFINLEARVMDADTGTVKEIGGDFYIDTTFSIGAAVSQQHSDNTYRVRTRKFFNEQFSGELSYEDAPATNTFTAGVSVRF